MKFISKTLTAALLITAVIAAASTDAMARGGSSGGGGRGGFSSGASRSYSSPSAARAPAAPAPRAPSAATQPSHANVAPAAPQRYAQPQTVQRPSQNVATNTPRTTTTTTTTTNHSYSSRVNYGGGVHYGGFGYGYPYMGTNGLLTGMIIGSMMHPHNTVVYAGPGTYSNNALLYPDGRVVNQQGYQVGTYVNGQFAPMENGGMVAQSVPRDAYAAPQPVVIQKTGPSFAEMFLVVVLGFACVIMFLGLIFGIRSRY